MPKFVIAESDGGGIIPTLADPGADYNPAAPPVLTYPGLFLDPRRKVSSQANQLVPLALNRRLHAISFQLERRDLFQQAVVPVLGLQTFRLFLLTFK
jgi:hypothetical protein